MAKVWLGPAGIPKYLAQPKTTLDAVPAVRRLGLNAMEVEFVQGVRMSREMAAKVGEAAKRERVLLSVHAPYFINLCSEDEQKRKASIERIYESVDRAFRMGAWIVVVHAAYYGKYRPEQCYEMVKQGLGEVLDKAAKEGIRNVFIGVEVMLRNAFGSIDETFRLAKEMRGVLPVIDWGHLYGREGGKLDFGKVLDLWRSTFGETHMHTHFTSVTYRNGKFVDEHQPIDANMPPFEPLAQELAKRDMSITLICESPLLDQDSVKMLEVLTRHGVRLAEEEPRLPSW